MESNALSTSNRKLPPQVQDDDDEIDLLKLWQISWRDKWRIITFALVVTMITVFILQIMTPIYRGETTLLISPKQGNIVSINQIYGLDGGNAEYLETQFELLKSRTLAERVVNELQLTTHPEFDPRQQESPLRDIISWISSLTSDDPKSEPTEEEIFASVVKAFMKQIEITPIKNSALVVIEVEMADSNMAAQAANRLGYSFIENQLEVSMALSATATSWMSSRLGELHAKLKAAEVQLQEFREKENLVDIGGVSTISAAELSATSDRMVDARRNRAEAQSLYQQVQSMKSGGWRKLATVSAVLGDPLIQQFKAKEAQAKAKVDDLSKRYGERHPTMESARTELTAAEASLRGQVEQVVAAIERNYRLAVANESSLRSSVNESRSQIQDISRKEFQLREYQREVDSSRALYDTFLTRLKETAATSDVDTANAIIVDLAIVPNKPAKPKKVLIVLLVGFLAGLVGVGLNLLLDMFNNTFKSPEDVENNLDLPVLGILPLIKKIKRQDLAKLFDNEKDKNKAFSESIRTIRTSMVLSGLNKPHKVMVVTSSVPDEGKSILTSNLAVAMGQMEKVLLIDADMRRPMLAKNFGFTVGTPGLANLIAGTAQQEECIQHTHGIDMISAGAVPPNPLQMLSSERFVELIEHLKGEYDRIIIDSPPIQAVSDALMIGSLADDLIYVIKSQDTAIPLAVKGIGQLLQNNVPVTGVVLNQVDMKKAKKQGYNYSGYYDYYGYSNPEAKV